MPRSMTGFGRGSSQRKDRRFKVEVRAVNHRYFDFTLKGPRFLNAVEDRLRNRVMQDVSRGKVDVWVGFETTAPEDYSVSVNELYADAYKEALVKLCEKFELGDASGQITLGTLLGVPDILTVSRFEKTVEDDSAKEELWTLLKAALDEAVVNFNKMRSQEGAQLANDIMDNYFKAFRIVGEIRKRQPALMDASIDKMKQRLTELSAKLDANLYDARLISEFAVLVDKSDIGEELARLASHFEQLKLALGEGGEVGRKIDFIVQEMNRETNTIGSKSQASELAVMVVELKSVIEKIREQAQNIE